MLGFFPTAPVLAQAALQELSTGEEGRAWRSVGRLNINKSSFCTGSLIDTDLVLTAAHCLFDKDTGARQPLDQMEFLAGWRNGRAEAYRGVKRAVLHPRYQFTSGAHSNKVGYDLALLELDRPVRLPGVQPFGIGKRPGKGAEVGVVSYALNRSEAPSLQEICHVLAGRPGVLMLNCSVDFGASGAPIFDLSGPAPQIVSIVSAKAEVSAKPIALGATVQGAIDTLKSRLSAGIGVLEPAGKPAVRRFGLKNGNGNSGAKFLRP
ncbi:trypsin-like serine peptidase [Actibacterium mucosum]